MRLLVAPLLALLASAGLAAPAAEQVIFEIHAPQRFRDADFELRAGDAVARSRFDAQAFGKVALALSRRAQVTVSLAIVDSYEAPPRPWRKEISLNGSGRVEWTLSSDSATGSFSQWPSVTWSAAGERLDVSVDGRVTGTTTTSDGLQPGRRHTVLWLRSRGRVERICSAEVQLPPNVERTYTCDPRTRKVSED